MTFAMQLLFGQFKGRAIAAAQTGVDPEVFALQTLEIVPPAYEATIYGAVAADTWFANLFGDDPAAQVHRAYLEHVRGVILAELEPEAPPEGDKIETAPIRKLGGGKK